MSTIPSAKRSKKKERQLFGEDGFERQCSLRRPGLDLLGRKRRGGSGNI